MLATQYEKKWNLIQNSPAVKNVCSPKKAIVKKDAKSKAGGSQEMAVMVV